MNKSFLAVGCLLVGVGRLTVPGHSLSWAGTYEAFAHIWIGVLICLATQNGIEVYKCYANPVWTDAVFGFVLSDEGSSLLILTILETVMFLFR